MEFVEESSEIELQGINPYSYFVDILQRVSVTKSSDVAADLMPIR